MSEWPRVNLRRVAKLGTGHTPSRQHPEYWVDCTIPWLTLADVWQLRDGTRQTIEETSEKISEAGLANSAAVLHPAGTVALSRTASVGFSCILSKDMATSQDYVTWTCGPSLRPRYLLHALRGLRDEILATRMGSTHQTIYMPDIERISIPLPPIDIQEKIADYLDAETGRIDNLIARRQRQVELLWERLKALAQEATGRTSIHGRGSSGICSRSVLSRAASAIRTGTTPSDLVDSSEGHSDGFLPWYTPAAINHSLQIHPTQKYAPEGESVPIFPPGSILITGIGESLGKIGYLTHAATGNQQLTAIQPSPMTDGRFIAWQLWAAQDEIRNWAQFSRVRIINNETLASFPIHLPRRDTQNLVSHLLDKHLNRLILLKQATDRFRRLMQEHRQALITAAVTGELDVARRGG
jgi:type I restriction enzyme S subunit